jgi:hypothetical protein
MISLGFVDVLRLIHAVDDTQLLGGYARSNHLRR